MAITDYIEYGLAKLLPQKGGHAHQVITKGPAFKDIPENITITSPDNGPSGSKLITDCTQVGADRFPELTWDKPSFDVKEYLVIVEDVDAPLPMPITHGLFWGIPGTITSIKATDVEPVDKAIGKAAGIKAGWNIGKNIRGTVYSGARPLLEHGRHRYFYEVIALKEPISPEGLSKTAATKQQLAERIEGKVAGWGVWEGWYERKWPGTE